MGNSRKLLLSFLAVVGVVAALWVGLCFALRRADPFEAQRFDAAAWAAAGTRSRASMARDAIRQIPGGLPEGDIEPLLGEPDKVYESQRVSATAPERAVRTYSYFLGCWSGQYYDSTFLWVHVGSDGRVIEAVIGGG